MLVLPWQHECDKCCDIVYYPLIGLFMILDCYVYSCFPIKPLFSKKLWLFFCTFQEQVKSELITEFWSCHSNLSCNFFFPQMTISKYFIHVPLETGWHFIQSEWNFKHPPTRLSQLETCQSKKKTTKSHQISNQKWNYELWN